MTTSDAVTIRALQAEVREFKHANEVLLAASSTVVTHLFRHSLCERK